MPWDNSPFYVIGRGIERDSVIVEIDAMMWGKLKTVSWPKYEIGEDIPEGISGWETLSALLHGLGVAVRTTGKINVTNEPVETVPEYCERVGEAMAAWARQEIAEREAEYAKFSAFRAQQDAAKKANDDAP